MESVHLALVPILLVIVQCLKAVPFVAARTWCLPFVAMALGVLLAYAYEGFPPRGDLAWTGLMAGLAASGSYKAIKGPWDAAQEASRQRRDTLT